MSHPYTTMKVFYVQVYIQHYKLGLIILQLSCTPAETNATTDADADSTADTKLKYQNNGRHPVGARLYCDDDQETPSFVAALVW